MADEIGEDLDELSDIDELKEEEKEEKEEDKELEEKEEEDPEDKEEIEEDLPASSPRPRIADIKKEFPELFKKFPGIRDAIIREDKYTQEFSTIQDAKDAKEKAESFDYLQSDITAGNAEKFLEAVNSFDPKGAEKFVDNFIPSLYKVNEKLYWNTITPILQRFVRSMHDDGKRTGNDNLVNSSLYALQFMGMDEKGLEIKQTRPSEPSEKEKELSAREQKIEQDLYLTALNSIDRDVSIEIKSEIAKLIEKDNLSVYEKRSFAKDILESFNEAMNADKQHNALMTAMWQKAQKGGYNKELTERIKTAYLSRAKSVLPSIRSKVRKEVFASKSEPKKKVEKEPEEKQEKRTASPMKKTTPSFGLKSDLEILNS